MESSAPSVFLADTPGRDLLKNSSPLLSPMHLRTTSTWQVIDCVVSGLGRDGPDVLSVPRLCVSTGPSEHPPLTAVEFRARSFPAHSKSPVPGPRSPGWGLGIRPRIVDACGVR